MAKLHPRVAVWQSVRALPEFRRLLELRAVSLFGDGLFQGGLAGALLFNPERAANPWAIAGAFAVLFLPYSLLGPFAGALLDRWDRRLVLIGATLARLVLILGVAALLAVGADDLTILCGALIVNGFNRFVSSGLSAALPHVVPRELVVTLNSVATAVGAAATFLGANFMLVPRWLVGTGDTGSATIIFIVVIPVGLALFLAARFKPHVLGPDDSKRAVHGSVAYAVATGWGYGVRTVVGVRTVGATLAGLAAHRVVFGVNTLLVLVIVRHTGSMDVGGLGIVVVFVASTGLGSFLANFVTPLAVRRWGRYATANGALGLAAVIQVGAAGLDVPMMVGCGFVLGAAGQVVKLCADSAIQIDVDDAMRGHVFTIQDSVFWLSFVAAIAAAAAVIPGDGDAPGLVVAGTVVYLIGLAAHAAVGRGTRPADQGATMAPGNAPLDGLVADLRAETDALDDLVAGLDDDGWRRATPAPGWTIAHQIAHLWWTDRVALVAVTDEAGFGEILDDAASNPVGFVDASAEQLATTPPAEMLAEWRITRGRLHDELCKVSDGRKLPWFGPPMSATSMATARLMETWAHGLDVADALGVRRPATARLRPIAHIGVRTRDFAFTVHGLPPPSEPFLVELLAPDGSTWSWGPTDADQRVAGSAEHFCMLVTQRRPRAELDVTANGADAQKWLTIAQAFAGPPGTGRG